MRCKTCHHSLENLTEHRCPECGTAFDPKNILSDQYANSGVRVWHMLPLFGLITTVLFVLGLFFSRDIAFDGAGHRVITVGTIAACMALILSPAIWLYPQIRWRR